MTSEAHLVRQYAASARARVHLYLSRLAGGVCFSKFNMQPSADCEMPSTTLSLNELRLKSRPSGERRLCSNWNLGHAQSQISGNSQPFNSPFKFDSRLELQPSELSATTQRSYHPSKGLHTLLVLYQSSRNAKHGLGLVEPHTPLSVIYDNSANRITLRTSSFRKQTVGSSHLAIAQHTIRQRAYLKH